MFVLVRYLRNLNYNVFLFLLDESNHFLPKNDTFSNEYEKYTLVTSWDVMDPQERKKDVMNKLEDFNIIIGCGRSPAYLNEINKCIDIFIPYGSDLYEVPDFFNSATSLNKNRYAWLSKNISKFEAVIYRFPRQANFYFRKTLNKKKEKLYRFKLSEQQLKGIQNCKYIILNDTKGVFENVVNKIQPKGKRMKISLPIIYEPLYNPLEIEKYYSLSQYYSCFKKIRNNHELMLFHHTRHQWKTAPDEFSWKGNDILIKGFAGFVKQHPEITSCLIMLEYGWDVEASKKLVKDLGIENKVFWFPVMPRKEIMIAISLCDIGCSEFAISWDTGGTIYEILSMGKPLFHYLDLKQYVNEPELIFPHQNIKNEIDITDALSEYINNKEKFIQMGIAGREWFKKNAVQKPLKEIEAIIEEIVST